MKSKYPIKKLSILNIGMTFACVLFSVVIIYINTGSVNISKLIIGVIILLLTSFSNILLLVYYKKWFNIEVYVALSFTVSFLVFFLVSSAWLWLKQKSITFPSIYPLIIVGFLINSFFLIVQKYVINQEDKINSDIENAQLKVANAEAANQLLRQQIHPHMLFNSLNTIKSLYNRNTADADEYLAYLSDFLRASILNNNIKVIPLDDELKLCEAYLAMQKIRFGEALTWFISVSNSGTLEKSFIPSFSIQPLVENAIKHNELTEKYPLHISIKQTNDRIKVSNKIRLKECTETSSGFGLANLAERYKHISDDEVIIEDNDHIFSVSIKILNHENSNHRG